MTFRAIILINNQRLNHRQAIGNHCPDTLDAIRNGIAGVTGRGKWQ
jgi:putative protein kinase ArgK-like GTPase of G3E family